MDSGGEAIAGAAGSESAGLLERNETVQEGPKGDGAGGFVPFTCACVDE